MELRKGYKQTEVGVIPEKWEVKKLGIISSITKLAGFEYSLHFNSYNDGGDIIVVRGTNITHNKMDLSDVRTIPSSTSNKLQRSKLFKNDLVFAYVGTIGPVYLIEENDKYHLGPNTSKITAGNEAFPQFLYHYFKSWLLKNEIVGHTSIGAQPSLSMSKIRSFRIVLPTKAEQTAISSALSDADALISGMEKLIAKKRNIKQGTMQQLLTSKKRLPGFSGKWQQKQLGNIVQKFINGGTPSTLNAEYWAGNIPWITGADFVNQRISEIRRFITDEAVKNSSTHVIGRGNLLLVTRTGVGKLAIAPFDIAISQDITGIYVKSDIDIKFLFHHFNFNSVALKSLNQGTSINGITRDTLSTTSINLPCLKNEQTAIATILSDMDAEIEKLEQKLNKYRMIKQGMMQELLAGRIRFVQQEMVSLPMTTMQKESETIKASSQKNHNWEINEAVVISILVDGFGSEKFPLGRKRYTKLSYLLHRHVEIKTEGYRKKAAGPYNPDTKYKGPEKIALENGYIKRHTNGQFSGFIADDNIEKAKVYFAKWYGEESLKWLEQFRFNKNDDLELLTTVDMAICDLAKVGQMISVANIKDLIYSYSEWKAKLNRSIFSDVNIAKAIKKSQELFVLEES
jgi:type I restriction enzyme S subunit